MKTTHSHSHFNRGLRKVLIKLKKQGAIFSFEKIKDNLFVIKFHVDGNKVFLHTAFSIHYKGALLPKDILHKEYQDNAIRFCIGYGALFCQSDIKSIEKIIKRKSQQILKGFYLEKKFLKDSQRFLLQEENKLGLVEVVKTSSIQEQNGFGDFALKFHDKEVFIDIKSSAYGVYKFIEKYNHHKKTIAVNYNKRKQQAFQKLILHILSYRYVVAV